MAFSGTQITRLGAAGVPRPLYGSFAGKAEAVVVVRLTRLGLSGIPRGLYGSFAGKAEAAAAGGADIAAQIVMRHRRRL